MKTSPRTAFLPALLLMLALGLAAAGCTGHRQGHPERDPVTLDEALSFARIDYTDGTIPFSRYLDVLDSLARAHPGIGKKFLQNDEAFERFLEGQVKGSGITVDQYRRYLRMKLGFLQDYSRTVAGQDTAGR